MIARGVGAFTDFVGGSIQAASDLEQSIGGVQSVFGDSANQILDWGKTAHDQAGLSRNAFNQLASPLGAMLKNAGIEDFTGQTIELTKRAADMAATFGGPVDQALGAITAALRGETDPIERYGVSLNAAKVEARALADTGKDTAASLTDQEKATARIALLYEQTADAAGQFGRESETAAGKVERQRAAQENAAAQLGEQLLPIQIKVTEAKLAFVRVLSEHVIPMVEKAAGWLGDKLAPAFDTVRDFAERAGGFIRDFVGDIQWAIENGTGFNEKLAPQVAGVTEVIAGLVIWVRDELIPAFREVAPKVQEFGEKALGAIATTIERDILPKLETFVDFLRDDVVPILVNTIAPAVKDFAQASWPKFESIFGWLADHKDVLVAVGVAWAAFTLTTQTFAAIQGVQAMFTAIALGVKGVNLALLAPPGIALLLAAIATAVFLIWQNWDEIWPKLQAGWELMKEAAVVVKDAVVGAFNEVVDFLRNNWPEVATLLAGPFAPIVLLATDAFGVRTALTDAVTGMLEKLGEFKDMGIQFIGGLLEGAAEKAIELLNWMFLLPGEIVSQIPNPLKVLEGIGMQVIQGLWNGATEVWEGFVGWLGEQADKLPEWIKGPLRINSPSRVMYDVGVNIMAGLDQGARAWWASSVYPFLTYVTDFVRSWGSSVASTASGTGGLVFNPNATLDPTQIIDARNNPIMPGPNSAPFPMASGGIVRARPGGMLALIGEGGKDEAVIPLDGQHKLGGNTYNISFASLDPRAGADYLLELLVDLERRGGVTRGTTRALA